MNALITIYLDYLNRFLTFFFIFFFEINVISFSFDEFEFYLIMLKFNNAVS